jgi:anti-sigma factor RsiW
MRGHIKDHELMRLADGELTPRLRSRLARHVDLCRACREKTDSFRSTMADVEAFYRVEHDVALRSPDYGRVRLASALRELAESEPTWWQRLSHSLDGLSLSRHVGVGVTVMAVCAAALIAVRATTEPAVAALPSGALPQSSLTPGAISQLTSAELCNGVRPSRLVTETVRQQVVRAYGIEAVPAAAYELDALITPELGGSTDPANLWPQAYHSSVWNARVKDELERLLPEMVCNHQITLAQAQQEIASDWIAAYKRYFRTETPLRAHMGPSDEEEDELLFAPSAPASTQIAALRTY